MIRPSSPRRKRDTLIKLIVNAMCEHEDGATFDNLAESVADALIDTVFLETENQKLFWDQYYTLRRENRKLKFNNHKLVKKYKRMRDKEST